MILEVLSGGQARYHNDDGFRFGNGECGGLYGGIGDGIGRGFSNRSGYDSREQILEGGGRGSGMHENAGRGGQIAFAGDGYGNGAGNGRSAT
jgi:hypothetical protein